jgi:hypothetical protein
MMIGDEARVARETIAWSWAPGGAQPYRLVSRPFRAMAQNTPRTLRAEMITRLFMVVEPFPGAQIASGFQLRSCR